ncbi:hypothetical protein GPECTOR_41g703 [Gonium pectorale]|uniref:Uncharacterized protein n=1 Tax=Gonium pectorale TaxID=33097 RepID=A0A150GA88_GONPE|nr:hypothetical protein GPECTOR_41g703 [Gonium pectorale]|eukprot:KXZ46738.1 hypothetical protein GPECTOR_41g703 [Gonium pectorale]
MSSLLEEYQAMRATLTEDLGKIERLGFEGFLNSKDVLRKKTRSFKPEDRLFSLSSKSSPVTKEMEQPLALETVDSMTPLIYGKKYAQKGYAQKGKR